MKKTLLIFLLILSQVFSAQSDCPTAITVCGNSGISYTPTGPGNILEDLGGCLVSDEHFSVWYTFTISTAGTLTFTIDPNVFVDDYDFAVYGPNKPCGNLGLPVRCNYSGADGPTGLDLSTNGPTGIDASGNLTPWSGFMNVLPGETYYLVVDNFSSSANGFTLSWGGTASLASPFNDPGLITNPFIAPGVPNANPNDPNEVVICTNPAIFNFSSLSPAIINGNTNFTVSYHYNINDLLTGDNPITAPITVNTTNTYYYSITYTDPTNPNNPINKCKQTGDFKFKDGSIVATDATLTECNNNNEGTAVFNLTTANVINNPTATKKYFPSMFDLNGNTNEITNPYQYLSAGGSVFVLVTSEFGCTDIAEIKLNFYPVVVVNDATVRACFIETNPSTGLFDLTNVSVNQTGALKKYYPSATDAVNQTNEIINADTYVAPNGFVYVRVTSADGCFNVAKITLVVIPPVYSTVLIDKVICMEDRTTLDAGPGFDGYEWSTGATTQTISNVAVGTYWVKLRTGDCTSTQSVKVFATEQPVVSNIEITNNSININVTGGTPAYQYSLDNVHWQDSNVFSGLTRGDYTVFVRDAYDCTPIEVNIVVPNIVNVITPNGDGINDVIDYSALSTKSNLVLTIFDRYGTKIHQADKTNNYTWNGTIAGKKIPTGTYWYSVTWNENNKNSTPIKFSGWVMVKNRD
ncbi:T9SS type B sorting domain-containing protein [Chryseobacterium wangxinyae]|uniref:T9SS type B sorting domain-containing protein n=1 Tax=Chryseobacterium sp. CY350 TaxID=2997336 RepID=UPI00226F7477|nr:T9SS type B sorting domain-containing protein [Chryseobacterium sp. CY350]MCY0975862.1 T9SS type B sorting domain-containing protein [Chryseobacterium sp. CY350]WBZ94529.1 T9SS type B sorting domain-containing protein [Chryseobacterium sp. CY350]